MSEHSCESLEAVSARVWSARDSYLIPDSIALPFQYAIVVFLVKLRISALAQLHTCSRTYYITQTIAMIQTENICIKMGWDAFVFKWSVWNIMFHYCKAAKDIKNVKYLARYIGETLWLTDKMKPWSQCYILRCPWRDITTYFFALHNFWLAWKNILWLCIHNYLACIHNYLACIHEYLACIHNYVYMYT